MLDDLHERGMLDDVLIVMAGEFGRTPKVFTFDGAKSKLPGRDHWGMVQSVFFAGGGVKGGQVIAPRTRSAATRPPIRRSPRAWPRRSTSRSGCRRRSPGRIRWIVRTMCITATPDSGLV